MIKHIVMWKLKEEAEGAPASENAARMKFMLEALQDKIEEAKKVEVSTEIFAADPHCDVALYSEFDSRADLAAYLAHEEHQACLVFIKKVVAERRAVDYEI